MPRKELASLFIAILGFAIVYIGSKLDRGTLQIILFILAALLILLSMATIFIYDAKKDGLLQAFLNMLVGWFLLP
jgi:hypothetical protein